MFATNRRNLKFTGRDYAGRLTAKQLMSRKRQRVQAGSVIGYLAGAVLCGGLIGVGSSDQGAALLDTIKTWTVMVTASPASPIEATRMANNRQITGNIGVYHVARELSRFGWNVMLTVRNARGADLYAVSQCETIMHPIQVKAHGAEPTDTRLGLTPDTLVTPWWVFVTHALSDAPSCYIVSLDEIRSRMTRDPGTRSGKPESDRAFWLDRRFYKFGSDRELVDAREGWACLGNPKAVSPMKEQPLPS